MTVNRFIGQRWFQVFVGGVTLFFGSEQALKLTGNPNFVPTVILLGAFVVPAAFVAFFYSEERNSDKALHIEAPLNTVALCFFVGGVIGTIVAGFVEYATLGNLPALDLLGVGAIEESAKLILPIAVFVRGRYRSEMDGLVFGVASGMGFAAMETMGYGLVTLMRAQGNVGSLQEVLLVRGLLSPLGHAAWTGLVCAAMWRQRQQSKTLFAPAVVGIFFLTIGLHVLWDLAGSSNEALIAFPSFTIIGAGSLALLIRKLRSAKRPKEGAEPGTSLVS